MVELTNHVCQRYIERINPNLASINDINERLNRAKIAIKTVLSDAHYVSDDERGILLYSETYNCNLIIQRRKLITIYPVNYKSKIREQNRNPTLPSPFEKGRRENKYKNRIENDYLRIR
jgi:hypothetical protein